MRMDVREIVCGAIFLILGAFFALHSVFNLRIGQAFSMGPGYFPVLLGSLLAMLGLAITFGGFGRTGAPVMRSSLRGTLLVCLAVLVFAFCVRGLGLLPTMLAASFAAGLAPRGVRWRSALAVSVGLTAFSILIFVVGLRLPYALIGPWLRF